ncbi:MAG: FtsQ-type POTRA domain-containing protein [Erysipelotrichaceae bacterium]|nr:FtsQ-type POTRA domain-containing protein [Erysipelotrichaceae bacterium]
MAYVYNEYDENQIRKTLKKRKRKKIKRRIKFLIALLVVVCVTGYLFSDLSRIRTIKITGLEYTTEEEALNVIDCNETYMYFLVDKSEVAEKVETLPAVEKATVSIGIFGGMTIKITETTAIAYACIDNQYYMINNAGKVVMISDEEADELKLLTYVQNFTSTEMLSEFAKQYKDVPSLMQNEISDIVYSPQSADETRLQCITKEGRYIYIRIEDLASRLSDDQFNYELYKSTYSDKCTFSIEGNYIYMSEDCE